MTIIIDSEEQAIQEMEEAIDEVSEAIKRACRVDISDLLGED